MLFVRMAINYTYKRSPDTFGMALFRLESIIVEKAFEYSIVDVVTYFVYIFLYMNKSTHTIE